MSRTRFVRPRRRLFLWQTAQRGASVGRSRLRTSLPAEVRRKEHGARVGIEQDLRRLEALTLLRLPGSFDAIGVEGGAAQFARGDATMPDGSGFVRRMLQAQLESRRGRILFAKSHQGNSRRVARVESEVEGLLGLHPRD